MLFDHKSPAVSHEEENFFSSFVVVEESLSFLSLPLPPSRPPLPTNNCRSRSKLQHGLPIGVACAHRLSFHSSAYSIRTYVTLDSFFPFKILDISKFPSAFRLFNYFGESELRISHGKHFDDAMYSQQLLVFALFSISAEYLEFFDSSIIYHLTGYASSLLF